MNALVPEQFDNVLTKAPQSNAPRPSSGFAATTPKVARGRIGLHAQQQIGRGQVEEAQRMGLHHLRRFNIRRNCAAVCGIQPT